MNKYKILWIDDQYELLSELMERCEVVNGFEITKCRFAKEGMKTYENHLEELKQLMRKGTGRTDVQYNQFYTLIDNTAVQIESI